VETPNLRGGTTLEHVHAMATSLIRRRLPVGAEPQGDAGTHLRVWAPAAQRMHVVRVDNDDGRNTEGHILGAPVALAKSADGYFEGLVAELRSGSRYWLQIDGRGRYADPASRYQPFGPHGPSEVVDPAYRWRDLNWRGHTAIAPVIYEVHIGTFTRAGTFTAAERQLPALVDLGISTIEIMPIADFPGRFGWGYDGVLPFAPAHQYGTPDELRSLVDQAHACGLAVVLDVVYNHFGPDGCHLRQFSPAYFADIATEWGDAINFDGPSSGPVREFFCANARYWISEFHFDGLRLDATQSIHDTSEPHILTTITADARDAAAGRRLWIVAENEPQDATLVRPVADGGYGIDAMWNDDFHHTAMVALTGHREAYYTDYRGTPAEFVAAARRGFLFQGQWYSWQKQPRGTSTRGVPPSAFVAFLQNHDQVANSIDGARGTRLSSPGRWRALTALLLLGPWTPLLFQGQEYDASTPFLFFADHQGDLGAAVRQGRREFLRQFPSLALDPLPLTDPSDVRTFEASRLDPSERTRHTQAVTLHQSLVRLRRHDPAFHDGGQFSLDAAVLTREAFVLRYCAADVAGVTRDRLLLINLGADATLDAMGEPLLSPHPASHWRTVWSSDDIAVGGRGRVEIFRGGPWFLPGESATVLASDGGA
jgi:maltooligosyltrehalose trehalohydrolase